VRAGSVDQPSDDGEGGGQVEVKLDDDLVLVGAAAELAVAVHPRARALDGPALAGLDRGGLALTAMSRSPSSISSRSRVWRES
jgi:hypothetical protein